MTDLDISLRIMVYGAVMFGVGSLWTIFAVVLLLPPLNSRRECRYRNDSEEEQQ